MSQAQDPRPDMLAHAFAQKGIKAFTREQYSRQGMLDALRENRRRNQRDPLARFMGEAARTMAKDLQEVVDLPAADIATVLLAAGGSVGVLAEVRGLHGTTVAGVLQCIADELDQAANGGERS
ncbi:hypothetical protein LZP81_31085 [Streptomyces parvulus]|uniref:hypothetical protein n=1 Tax=Streptomyces parvulus TaxID=146923 RepID=UPI001E506D93|nr:hypothetical protein [Streptomyces parvulus]MCC9154851.1 hypothetical protein [Streptomyces parvulus]MCE7691304.1 hypothetical protein [Streptomyces parvulus]